MESLQKQSEQFAANGYDGLEYFVNIKRQKMEGGGVTNETPRSGAFCQSLA